MESKFKNNLCATNALKAATPLVKAHTGIIDLKIILSEVYLITSLWGKIIVLHVKKKFLKDYEWECDKNCDLFQCEFLDFKGLLPLHVFARN